VAAARFHAADAVVWLDLPRSTCLCRVTLRKLRGNPAPLPTSWRWIWRYANHGRLETESALTHSRLPCAIFRLHSGNEVDKLLLQIDGFRS
jgi:hypothetical protein